MKHMTEEELIAYREGVAEQRAVISEHLRLVKNAAWSGTNRGGARGAGSLPCRIGADYGRQVWRAIAPRLAEKPVPWWQVWMEPWRLAAAGAVVAMISRRLLPADHKARHHRRQRREQRTGAGARAGGCRRRTPGPLREMLVELSNAAPKHPAQKQVNHSAEQRRAEICWKKTAVSADGATRPGMRARQRFTELERVLWTWPRPEEVTPAQLEAIQRKIEERGILFKVRWSTRTATAAGGHEACAGAERIHEKRKEQSMTIGNSLSRQALCGSPGGVVGSAYAARHIGVR